MKANQEYTKVCASGNTYSTKFLKILHKWSKLHLYENRDFSGHYEENTVELKESEVLPWLEHKLALFFFLFYVICYFYLQILHRHL